MTLASWVPRAEVACPPPGVHDPRGFTLRVLGTLREAGVLGWHARELAAVARHETGDGKSAATQVNNLAGCKLAKDRVDEFRKLTGKEPEWFTTAGHVRQGDPPRVQYLCYPTTLIFWACWLNENVGPYPGVEPWRGSRARAGVGRLFWRQDPLWRRALMISGYRGSQGEKDPDSRVAHHAELVDEVEQYEAEAANR